MNTRRDMLGKPPAARFAVTLAFGLFGLPMGAAGQTGTVGLGLPPGTPAPDARVEDMEGDEVSLLEVIGGRPALIEFWASWCEQCELLQPEIDRVQDRFGEEVAVVAVAVAVSQPRRRVRRHVERHAPEYAFVYDADGNAVRAYKALTTAVVVLVDGEGRIVSTGVGPGQELVTAVEALLQQSVDKAARAPRAARGRAGKARREGNGGAIRPRSNAVRSFGRDKCILYMTHCNVVITS